MKACRSAARKKANSARRPATKMPDDFLNRADPAKPIVCTMRNKRHDCPDMRTELVSRRIGTKMAAADGDKVAEFTARRLGVRRNSRIRNPSVSQGQHVIARPRRPSSGQGPCGIKTAMTQSQGRRSSRDRGQARFRHYVGTFAFPCLRNSNGGGRGPGDSLNRSPRYRHAC